MKLNMLTVAVAALAFSTFAQASNTGVIRFVGAVSDVTCDLIPVDENGAASHDIELGTVAAADLTDASPSATAVAFSLVPSPTSPIACTDGTKVVEVGFSGDYNTVGLANTSGTAGNTAVRLEGSTASGWHTYTVTGQNAVLASEANTGALKFRAALRKHQLGLPVSQGTVITQATYSVVYK